MSGSQGAQLAGINEGGHSVRRLSCELSWSRRSLEHEQAGTRLVTAKCAESQNQVMCHEYWHDMRLYSAFVVGAASCSIGSPWAFERLFLSMCCVDPKASPGATLPTVSRRRLVQETSGTKWETSRAVLNCHLVFQSNGLEGFHLPGAVAGP